MLTITILVGALALAALARFWNQVADFMLGSVMPWLKRNMPALEPACRAAFKHVDRLAVPVVRAIRAQWQKLSKWLVGQLVYYERTSSNQYVQKIVNYFRTSLESGRDEIEEETTTRRVSALSIPAEFRDKVLGLDSAKINTTQHVNKVIQQMIQRAEG